MMLTECTFDTGEVTINYAEADSSGPLLVLLHGIGSRWQVFLAAVPPLAARWRVVAVDLRGHGRSGRAAERYGLMDYARDIGALIRHLSDEPALVVGHSLGAMTAIGLASEFPDAVRAVVLEDPPLGAFSGAPFGARPEYPRFRATRDMTRAGHSAAEIARLIAPHMDDQDGVAIRARAKSLSMIDSEVFTAVLDNRANEGFDLGDRLRRVACPTLLLQGNPGLGGALYDSEARWAASLMRDCTLVTLPEAGHGIRVALPTRFVQLATEFLESV